MGLKSRFIVSFVAMAVCATLAAALSIGLLVYRSAAETSERLEVDLRMSLERQLLARSEGALSFLVAAIRNPLYSNDFDAMDEVARAAMLTRGVVGLRIYGEDGTTLLDGSGEMGSWGEPAPDTLRRAGADDGVLVWTEDGDFVAGQAVCAGTVCFGFASVRIDGDEVERERLSLMEHAAAAQAGLATAIVGFGSVATILLASLAGFFGAAIGGRLASGITAAVDGIQKIADGRSVVVLADVADPGLQGLRDAVASLSVRLERAQNYRAAVFAQFKDALFVASADGEIVLSNAAFDELFDVRKAGSALRVHDLLPIDADATGERMIAALARIVTLPRPGWPPVPVAVTCRVLQGTGGSASEVLGVVRDITEQAQREAEMERARAAAEAATVAKSQFLAVMSHELRTPLNGVLGGASLLASGRLDSDQQTYVDIIQNSGSLLLDLISDILELSRIEAGEVALNLSEFDLDELAHEAMSLHVPRAHAKKLSLRVAVTPRCPPVTSDRDKLRQILANLLGNAVKFTEQGSVELVADCAEAGGQPVLTLEVRDTGVGIPADKLESVFGTFVQVDSSATRKYEGTGLGLSITRSIVEFLGGSIVAENRDQGTTFRCVIPLARLGDAPPPERLRGTRVLIAHEDAVTAGTLALQLRRECADVLLAYATDGAAAACEAVDLVLVSTRLACEPGASGLLARVDGAGARAALLSARYSGEPARRDGADELADLAVPAPHERLVAFVGDLASRPAPVDRPVEVHPVASLGPRRTILVAEDNNTNRYLIEAFLTRLGHPYHMAEDGEAALALFRVHRPGIVLMDVSMPRRNGLEATRAIRTFEARERLRPAFVIGLTASALAGDEAKCLAAGMDRYLTKPIDFDLLAEILSGEPPTLLKCAQA